MPCEGLAKCLELANRVGERGPRASLLRENSADSRLPTERGSQARREALQSLVPRDGSVPRGDRSHSHAVPGSSLGHRKEIRDAVDEAS